MNIKKKIKSFFRIKDKIDYRSLYEDKIRESEKWEFKYNKLSRQLGAILKEIKL